MLRKTKEEVLVVCHAFDDPAGEIIMDLTDNYEITASFHGEGIFVEGSRLIVREMNARTGQSVLLQRLSN